MSNFKHFFYFLQKQLFWKSVSLTSVDFCSISYDANEDKKIELYQSLKKGGCTSLENQHSKLGLEEQTLALVGNM